MLVEFLLSTCIDRSSSDYGQGGGVSGGTVYVFRWNSRNELSVPPVEDLQKVWNWLNPAEVKAGETSASEQNLDRSIGDFLKTRPQPTGQYLAVPVN
jgi:hypothetical protein